MNRDNFTNWTPNEKGIDQLPEKVREYVVFLQETNKGLVARIEGLKKQRDLLVRCMKHDEWSRDTDVRFTFINKSIKDKQ